ncbi:hypothetical protein AB0J47_17935 [Nocardia sp. NPDC049737]|uniref:hypothetical protein n=1 Tax=Nocardia sp. NPDC049737 TaxID=3154358 RepID=UPI003427C3AD
MPGVAALSFDTLRTWNGEQSRAFEELSFQLLKEDVPPGTRAIRTGNPDGGVEWYATLPGGGEHGWQAKHVRGIDALLTAMTNSVERVVKERPSLKVLTFVISWNLATSTRGGERKSQRQKYENKVQVWQTTLAGAADIEFLLVQESDLLAELAKPEHIGRRWLWWGDLILGSEWLVSRYEQQASAASEKYRPDLQVDVPIQEDLLALGFDRTILARLNSLLRRLISNVADLHVRPVDGDAQAASLCRTIRETAATLCDTARALELQASDPPTSLDVLLSAMNASQSAIYAAEEYARELSDTWENLPDDARRQTAKPVAFSSTLRVRDLATAIRELDSWLDSSAGRSLRRRAYFLTGQAGSGKTHLLLDATRRALDAGRPAVFLAGAQFGQGNLWASITDQLGLETVGADVLLRAMDAAGEAASVSGSRFVLFIDALNETTPADFWRVHLPALRAAVARYPHIALVVSCRDTYQDLVMEGAESTHYIRRAHPGFAEREIEATQRYFSHYNLEAPRIPLLTPEFTLPLFLRMYCESLSQPGSGLIPEGHQGRITILERYLAAKTATVARRFRPNATSAYELDIAKSQVSRVLNGFLDKLSVLGEESMSTSDAEVVARKSLDSTEATRLLGLLQEEGVLTRERLYLGTGNIGEGVRIVFQAFSDFLLLKRRLALSDDPLTDPSVKSWLAEEYSGGIVEAATILFPELYGVEVPDLLGITLGDEPDQTADQDAWTHHYRAVNLYRSVVNTLPYRESRAVTQRTIDLLNDAQRYIRRDTFFRVLFMVSPQPCNRLNGAGLHRYLIGHRMPERDSDFGIATFDALTDSYEPVARLARWAAAGPYPSYDAEVIELACIPLCWLFSSPNRFTRDWITKALAQLLRGHLDVMCALVERFWTVDDPYVVQRVIAVAYGALLRSTPDQTGQATLLADLVRTRVFTPPVRPDELLLDAARGIVRWATGNGILPDTASDSSRRPYGLKLPGSPPTEAAIKAKYVSKEGQPDDEHYSAIYHSLFRTGDFGHYVVESGLHHFTRYRIGQQPPKGGPREPRFIQRRWQKFVDSLNDAQVNTMADWLNDPGKQTMWHFSSQRLHQEFGLSDDQVRLLHAVIEHPRPVNHDYPADIGRRWIFRRTLSLGWTPQLFGHADGRIGYGRGDREGHKAERWGKKYQWIAYHELLARVADNYQSSRHFDDSEPYEGLHQIVGDREIDPTLPPIDFRAFSERENSGVTAWQPPPIQIEEWPPVRLDFGRYRQDITAFLTDTDSEPNIANSAFVRDLDGNDWIVLESEIRKVDPVGHHGWRGLQEKSAIESLLVAADDARDFLAWLPNPVHHAMGGDLTDSYGHVGCCYVGEVGRIGPACYHRHDDVREKYLGGKSFKIMATAERYKWEGGSYDCSIEETARTTMPSTFMQRGAGLSLDMRGPSWVDSVGDPVFVFYEEQDGRCSALLVRASHLRRFLVERNLELIVLHWFDRMEITGDGSGGRPYVESSSAARITADLAVHTTEPHRAVRTLE